MGKEKNQPTVSERGTNTAGRPHLASVAAQIAAEFPSVLDRTSLVLLDVDPEHLHAFWTLAQEDLRQADAAFPSGGGPPEGIIRLRRLRPDGGADDLAALPIAGAARGDARFALANDDAAYQAEIGLRSAGGGWLLLARSNQSRLPRQVGVAIPIWDGIETLAAAGPSAPQTAVGTREVGHPSGGEAQTPTPAWDTQVPLPEAGTLPARWVLEAAARGRLDAAPPPAVPAPMPDPEGGAPVAPAHAAGPVNADLPAAQRWEPAIRADWPWAGSGGPDASGEGVSGSGHAWGNLGGEPGGGPSLVGTATATEAVPSATARVNGQVPSLGPPSPLSSFALVRGPESPLVEAELLVHVSARPGTLVELYGRRLRVGPAGHSTLRLPVMDPAVLELVLSGAGDSVPPDGA